MEHPRPYTPVETYHRLHAETPAELRLEYLHGVIYAFGQPYQPELATAMAGESEAHALVKDNIVFSLQSRLADPCRAFSSGLRVMAPGFGQRNYAYPDALVICGKRLFDDTEKPPVLTNPNVVIEVLSPSTRVVDYLDKREAYLRIPSVQEYWIFSTERPVMRQYLRQAKGVLEYDVDSVLDSPTLNLTIPLAEIYHSVFE